MGESKFCTTVESIGGSSVDSTAGITTLEPTEYSSEVCPNYSVEVSLSPQ